MADATPAPNHDDFTQLSEADLLQAYAASVQKRRGLDHIGAANRLFGRGAAILEALQQRHNGSLEPLRPLLQHPDAAVRLSAAIQFRPFDHAAFEEIVKPLAERTDELGWEAKDALRWDAKFQKSGYPESKKEPYVPHPPSKEMVWQCDHPPTDSISKYELNELIASACRGETAVAVSRLVRPAIGLWPQRPSAAMASHTSRLGGDPVAPVDWNWPMVETEPEDEPMLFLGQINCAELQGIAGAERLPASGLLSFFGDHDGVMGCDFGFGDAAVFYWEETETLVPQTSPMEPMEVIVPCGLAFRPQLDLPHPESRVLETMLQGPEDRRAYGEIYDNARRFGIPEEAFFYCSFSKLFGWPALVQQDLKLSGEIDGPDCARLLLQLDDYHNGMQSMGWGPGGSLYFLLCDADRDARRFENCEMEVQVT